MSKHCHVSISINDEQAFFLNQKIMSAYSGKLKKLIKQEKRTQEQIFPIKNSRISIEINGFPGGSNGFELISRFCYNNGGIDITVSNICLLYCCAVFLEMNQNLLKLTDSFLEGIFYWSWDDILESLKSCAQDALILSYADSCGLLERLICALLAKIAQNPRTSGGGRTESPSVFHSAGDTSSPVTSIRSYGVTSSPLLDTNPRTSGGGRIESPSGFHSACYTSSPVTLIQGSGVTTNPLSRISGGGRIESPSAFHSAGDTLSPVKPIRGSGVTVSPLFDTILRISGGSRIFDMVDDKSGCKPRLGHRKSAQTKTGAFSTSSSSSYSSSPTATSTQNPKNSGKSTTVRWWFDDLSSLPPTIIEKLIKNLGSYGKENNSIILTRFILHYLKKRSITPKIQEQEIHLYGGLADTAIHGIISSENSAFSCRGLLRILRSLSGFGISKNCRRKLENLIGSKLEEATLDDLLISGQGRGDSYDVMLVLRLIRIFVDCNNGEISCSEKMKRVGKLIDIYIAEIAPDHGLKMSKFVGVAQSLPDFARDCFDGLYKSIDMFLQSHPTLTLEERSKICKSINLEKLSLEACKEMAKNPRIPPTIAIQALKSQTKSNEYENENHKEENEELKMNIERMQSRVIHLEKACKEMKGQMSLLVRQNHFNIIPTFSSPTRLC